VHLVGVYGYFYQLAHADNQFCVSWWFQGLIFTGIWVIGHEVRTFKRRFDNTSLTRHQCGHGAFSPHAWLNDTIGFATHSFLLNPYFSWRISHRRHHLYHSSMERNDVYMPRTRSELGIPHKPNHEIEWDELFGDTPVHTLCMLMRQQLIGFPAYLSEHLSGCLLVFPLSALLSVQRIRTERISYVDEPL
jgi:hypothetical protein